MKQKHKTKKQHQSEVDEIAGKLFPELEVGEGLNSVQDFKANLFLGVREVLSEKSTQAAKFTFGQGAQLVPGASNPDTAKRFRKLAKSEISDYSSRFLDGGVVLVPLTVEGNKQKVERLLSFDPNEQENGALLGDRWFAPFRGKYVGFLATLRSDGTGTGWYRKTIKEHFDKGAKKAKRNLDKLTRNILTAGGTKKALGIKVVELAFERKAA